MAWGALGWWSGWVVLVVVRVALLVGLSKSGPLWALVWVPELLALLFGIGNAFMARERDESVGGLLVPALYCLGLWAMNGVSFRGDIFSASLLVLGALLRLWALLNLGFRFSVAGSAWVSLCDTGPYRWLRHPQAAARVLALLGVGIGVGTAVDLARVVLAFVFAVAVVVVEEVALSRWHEWRGYASRVSVRLLPGVW